MQVQRHRQCSVATISTRRDTERGNIRRAPIRIRLRGLTAVLPVQEVDVRIIRPRGVTSARSRRSHYTTVVLAAQEVDVRTYSLPNSLRACERPKRCLRLHAMQRVVLCCAHEMGYDVWHQQVASPRAHTRAHAHTCTHAQNNPAPKRAVLK